MPWKRSLFFSQRYVLVHLLTLTLSHSLFVIFLYFLLISGMTRKRRNRGPCSQTMADHLISMSASRCSLMKHCASVMNGMRWGKRKCPLGTTTTTLSLWNVCCYLGVTVCTCGVLMFFWGGGLPPFIPFPHPFLHGSLPSCLSEFPHSSLLTPFLTVPSSHPFPHISFHAVPSSPFFTVPSSHPIPHIPFLTVPSSHPIPHIPFLTVPSSHPFPTSPSSPFFTVPSSHPIPHIPFLTVPSSHPFPTAPSSPFLTVPSSHPFPHILFLTVPSLHPLPHTPLLTVPSSHPFPYIPFSQFPPLSPFPTSPSSQFPPHPFPCSSLPLAPFLTVPSSHPFPHIPFLAVPSCHPFPHSCPTPMPMPAKRNKACGYVHGVKSCYTRTFTCFNPPRP